MRTITFKSIFIKNFLSIGEEPIKIDFKKGVNLITGKNLDVPDTKNALGKSSIIESFNFAIFGDTLRNLKKDQIVNNITKGTTEVRLTFNCDSPKGNNNFEIIRTLNPSSLKVLKDGRDKSRDSIPNTTKYILEVIGADQAIFENCVILRANNTIPFLAKGKADKKKFIESLFNLDIINKMSKVVKDDINLNKRDLEVETKLKYQLENNITDYQQKLKAQQTNINNEIVDYLNDIKNYKDKITSLESLIVENIDFDSTEQKIKQELKKASKVILKVNADLQVKNFNIKNTNESLRKLKKLEGNCPTCGRPYDNHNPEHALTEEKRLNELIISENEELKKLKNILKNANTLQEIKEKELDELLKKKIKYSSKESEINSYKNKITSTEKLIDSIKNTNFSSLESLITQANVSLKEKVEAISKINSELKKFEIARYILSEEGIRAYIIKKLLDLLNFRIKYYLAKQNSQYTLTFDQYFEEEILNKRGIPISYGNLSGAEGKMLDLACLWAFKDILRLQGAVSFNISFYDEILDSSLDAKNSEIVCSILNEFGSKENQAIYLISHKSDITKMVTGDIINLQKKNGITTKIDE